MEILAEAVKMFVGNKEILKGIDFSLHNKEFLGIIGPNGSGKSTFLKCVYRVQKPTSGDIYFDGKHLDELSYRESALKLAVVAQHNFYSFDFSVPDVVLMGRSPHKKMLERDNLEDFKIARSALARVGMASFEKRMFSTLSGGEQQRVAIARALVNRPKVLLLDEPLGALDLRLRKDMQNELKRIQQAMGITFIYVTHDQEEALSMSDTVVVMDKGRIQQIGTPEDIYNEPKNAFVADFIGESNILDGIMLEDRLVKFFGRKFKCVDFGFEKNEPVDVVIRPEDIDIVAPDDGHLCGTVTSVTFKGVHYDTIVDFKGFKWLIQTTDFYEVGSYIGIRLEPEDIHIMHKSEYSGMFGDYSSYSAEYDEMDDPDLYPEDAEESEEASEGGEDEE